MQHLKPRLWGSKMFYGGDSARVDEWLRVFPPYFPKSLVEIDFSSWQCSPANLEAADELETQIVRRLKEVLPTAISCIPRQSTGA
jgi:hypothetical protein